MWCRVVWGVGRWVGKGAGYSANMFAEVHTLPSSFVVPQSSEWWRDCSPVQRPVQTAHLHICSGQSEDTIEGERGIGYSKSSFCDKSIYKCRPMDQVMKGGKDVHEGIKLHMQ